MNIHKTYAGVLFAVFMVISTSCEDDFLDINTDPNNPSEATLEQILPVAQGAMTINLSQSTLGMSQPTAAIMQQLVNFRIGTYETITGTSFTNQWQSLYYDALANNEQIIRQGTESGDFAYVGIAKLQKAFMFSVMVDLWGDIPYFEALQGLENLTPTFDDDRAIYTDLFRLIDEGIADLGKESTLTPGDDDIIYNGNLDNWIKFGNSLKLKLYNQVRLVEDVRAAVEPLLTEGNLMQSAADDFEFEFGESGAISPDNRHPGYTVEYAQLSRENNINPYFFNLMQERNDPRIPYYFYNQLSADDPQQVDYQEGRFVSVRFGSIGPNANTNISDIQTLQGLYPIGGRFDDEQGGPARANSGTGEVAQRMLTYFQTKFNEAELRLALGLGGEREAFEEAVRAGFDKVNSVAVQTGAAPPIAQETVDAYIADALARYDAAADPLQEIITEKYIASFGWGIDPYNDYRRTGYPTINDPETDNDPQTIRAGQFPLRLPYYASELATNPNAPPQPNIATDRVFWDPN